MRKDPKVGQRGGGQNIKMAVIDNPQETGAILAKTTIVSQKIYLITMFWISLQVKSITTIAL